LPSCDEVVGEDEERAKANGSEITSSNSDHHHGDDMSEPVTPLHGLASHYKADAENDATDSKDSDHHQDDNTSDPVAPPHTVKEVEEDEKATGNQCQGTDESETSVQPLTSSSGCKDAVGRLEIHDTDDSYAVSTSETI
jgi:hypothetical protein